MKLYLVVVLGSAIGGALRHGVNVTSARLWGTSWPYGTFAVNVIGSLAIGAIVSYLSARGHGVSTLSVFLTTGILGGFTTFSAFSLDVMLLYQRGRVVQAALYLGGSVVCSLVALAGAVIIVRRLT